MTQDVLTAAIEDLASRRDLSRAQAAEVLDRIMAGEASEPQIAAILMGLRTKGETEDELAGLAETMRRRATPVRPQRTDLVDTAGTGGGRRTYNVSTTAALIAAGAGCAVAKHGNRSATGLSGAADVLEALGARLDLDPEAVARAIDTIGFGFMFAPAHHAATRHVVPVRKALGVRTIFNLLGPLTNPAGARRQLVGVADPAALELVAGALARLDTDRALVVSSVDGLDELSTSAPTHVIEIEGGETRRYVVEPQDVGIPLAPPEAVDGGTPEENAAIVHEVLAGVHGPRRDIALLNAGAAIYAAGRADSLAAGVDAARAAIDDGAAAAVLESYLALGAEVARA